MRKKAKVKYVFECGCIRENPGYDKTNRRLNFCPEHGKPPISKIYFCVICGAEIPTKINCTIRLYCDACRAAVLKQRRVERYQKDKQIGTRLTEKQKSIIIERRQTCKHCLSKCLALGGILLKDENACLNCTHYQTMTVDEKIVLYSRNGQDLRPASWR